MNRQTMRQRYYLQGGVCRPLRFEVPPELEPEELDRVILTVPPLPVGAEEASPWLWVSLTLALVALGWWLS